MDNGYNNQSGSLDVWKFIHTLLKWKYFLLASIFGLLVISAIGLLLVDDTYRAEAGVLPPQGSGLMGGQISSMVNEVLPFASDLGGGSNTETYFAILNSKSAKTALINEFELMEVYEIDKEKEEAYDQAINRVTENLEFDYDEDDVIKIYVSDKDPERAAEMANYLIDYLNGKYIEISTREAKEHRLYIEKRYETNLADLRKAEDSLLAFQERHNIYDVTQQGTQAIKAVADLQSELISSQISLDIAQNMMTSSTSAINKLQTKIDVLEEKSRDFQDGMDGDRVTYLFPSFKKMPELGMEYMRRYRNVKIQSRLLEYTLPMYEQAKIKEQKSIPAVTILDKAHPPKIESAPDRTFIMIVLAFLFGLTFVFIALVMENLTAREETGNATERQAQHIALKIKHIFVRN